MRREVTGPALRMLQSLVPCPLCSIGYYEHTAMPYYRSGRLRAALWSAASVLHLNTPERYISVTKHCIWWKTLPRIEIKHSLDTGRVNSGNDSPASTCSYAAVPKEIVMHTLMTPCTALFTPYGCRVTLYLPFSSAGAKATSCGFIIAFAMLHIIYFMW